MPKLQRSNIPEPLLRHLTDRVIQRHVTVQDLGQFQVWLSGNPTVPTVRWYKRFPGFTICGEGALVKTFLTPRQTPIGTEVQ